MNWKRAIEKNREALAAIVAGLFALLNWLPGEALPQTLAEKARRALRRSLVPAESAARRLIVLYARTQEIRPPAPRVQNSPLPDFSTFNRENKDNKKPPRFRLIDPRRPLVVGVSLEAPKEDWTEGRKRNSGVPRIRFLDEPLPLVPLFAASASAATRTERSPAKLLNRLAALDHALQTIPHQAKRLAALMQRRKHKPPGPGRVGPVRPGHPPGWREKAKTEVQEILKECHGLLTDRVVQVPEPP